jgi:hypothetical protein
VKLTKCQNYHHHGGVFDAWTEWDNPQAEWAQGSADRPHSLIGRPGLKSVQPTSSWTRVYMRRGRPRRWRKALEVVPPGWPADRQLASYCLGQVGGAPQRPNKYPPPVEIRTHTPDFGNSTCKALILSVVARCSLVGRVVRL